MQHSLAHRAEERSWQRMVPGGPDYQQILSRGREYEAGNRMFPDDFRIDGDIRVTVAPAGKRFRQPHLSLFRRG